MVTNRYAIRSKLINVLIEQGHKVERSNESTPRQIKFDVTNKLTQDKFILFFQKDFIILTDSDKNLIGVEVSTGKKIRHNVDNALMAMHHKIMDFLCDHTNYKIPTIIL